MKEKTFVIGEWVIFPPNNEISRNGYAFFLEPRLIDLLTYFAKYPDQVLSRDELINNVWQRGMVTDHVVTQCISELRKSLKKGRDEDHDYIITVPKRGYKLVQPVKWQDEVREGLLISEDIANTSTLYQHEIHGVANKSQENVNTENVSEISLIEVLAIDIQPSSLPALQPLQQNELVGNHSLHRMSHFWEWLAFILALMLCASFIAVASFNARQPVPPPITILNPREITIRFNGGNSCTNGPIQLAYILGLTDTVTRTLNTFSTYLVHDQTNYLGKEEGGSGKSLYIEFINEHHYRAQQCFLSLRLKDHANNSLILDKRYVITANNIGNVQNDFFKSFFNVLKVTIPAKVIPELIAGGKEQNDPQQRLYQVLQWIQHGDQNSLLKARYLLEQLIIEHPDSIRGKAYQVLIALLLNSYLPYDDVRILQLHDDLLALADIHELQGTAILQQIYAIRDLSEGRANAAYNVLQKSMAIEVSWLNYVLLGKTYELKGENHLAADAYMTAFNLRPGIDTLNWVGNAIFHTETSQVTPYLNNYLSDGLLR
jgi:transcriptional activator of cad operon